MTTQSSGRQTAQRTPIERCPSQERSRARPGPRLSWCTSCKSRTTSWMRSNALRARATRAAVRRLRTDRAAARTRQGVRSARITESVNRLAAGGDRDGRPRRGLRRAASDRSSLWPARRRTARRLRVKHRDDRDDGSTRRHRASPATRRDGRSRGLLGRDDHPAGDRCRSREPAHATAPGAAIAARRACCGGIRAAVRQYVRPACGDPPAS